VKSINTVYASVLLLTSGELTTKYIQQLTTEHKEMQQKIKKT